MQRFRVEHGFFFGTSDEFNEIEHLIESYKKVLLFKQKETNIHRFYSPVLSSPHLTQRGGTHYHN